MSIYFFSVGGKVYYILGYKALIIKNNNNMELIIEHKFLLIEEDKTEPLEPLFKEGYTISAISACIDPSTYIKYCYVVLKKETYTESLNILQNVHDENIDI